MNRREFFVTVGGVVVGAVGTASLFDGEAPVTPMQEKAKDAEDVSVQICWKDWSRLCDAFPDIVSPENPARSVPESEMLAGFDRCGEVGPNYIQLNAFSPSGELLQHGDVLSRKAGRLLVSRNIYARRPMEHIAANIEFCRSLET